MQSPPNRLRLLMRHHATTITFVVIVMALAATIAITGVLATGGSAAGVGERPTFSPILVHNATTSDNPILLLLATFLSS